MESCSSKFFQERGELGVFFSHFSALYLHVFPYTGITSTLQLPTPTNTILFGVTTWYNSFGSFFTLHFVFRMILLLKLLLNVLKGRIYWEFLSVTT